MNLAIINFGSGNLHSVHKAFESVSSDLSNPYNIIVTNDPKEIQSADKIVLPGVGAFGDCKNAILNIEGLHASLEASVIKNKVPFMGICVGMQLLADLSYEFGKHSGFGWIPGEVRRITSPKEYKIPHMGWNEITFSDHKLFDNCEQGSDFYFVHSFYFQNQKNEHSIATTKYPDQITAAVCKENICGTQFHPEKSHINGKKIIHNFLEWKP
jgi:glutamine amidotransferase